LDTLARCWTSYFGGQFWANWPAWASFYTDVCGLEISEDVKAKFAAYRATLGACWWWPHRDFVMVCDRPLEINRDDRGRLHCEAGAAITFRDGWKLYRWHGTNVSERLILRPGSYTAEEIKAETNSEVVRALAERLGWDKFLRKIGARTIDAATVAGLRYELLETSHKFADGQARWLKMRSPKLKDGTQPTYLEPVHPALTSAKAARRWQCDPSDPSPEECNANPNVEFAEEA
jgi:hypothetical protein